MTTIAHIVNPFKAPETQDVSWQQPMSLESMRLARKVALDGNINVTQYACVYEEDAGIVPKDMKLTPMLQESTLGKFNIDRKLPYFKEILDGLYAKSDANYFIQTNIDIILAPHFYLLVNKLIQDGVTSFCINKRIVPENFQSEDDLPLIWSMYGGPHNGMDCFVFPRESYPEFEIGDISMGVPWSETTLMASMIRSDPSFVVLRNAIATYHVGDERTWLAQELNDYRMHNIKEFCLTLKRLSEEYGEDFMQHPELQIFGFKLQKESKVYGWEDVPEFKYWLDKGYGEDVDPQILKRLVGYS